jgi:hypothetical protein
MIRATTAQLFCTRECCMTRAAELSHIVQLILYADIEVLLTSLPSPVR